MHWRWRALCLCLCLALLSGACAQTGSAPLLLPAAIAFDAQGNLYLADSNRNQVLEATLAGTLVVVAGNGTQGFAGDGGAASAAELNRPQGLAFGSDGTLYIADTGNARIRSVHAGTIATFAGAGLSAYGGDNGAATAASFRSPTALSLDSTGALLICDPADHRVRRDSNGLVTTFAGNGVQGFSGDGGAATAAELDSPAGIVSAPDGRVFLADTHNQRVRVVATNGTISTFAGTGQRGFAGDGGQASAAELSGPRGLAWTSSGTLLIADADNQRLRSVDAAGIITTIAGAGLEGTSSDGAAATHAPLHAPRTVALSNWAMPVIADTLNSTVRFLTPAGALYQPAALAPGRVSAVQATWPATLTYGQGITALLVTGAVGVPAGAVTISEAGVTVASASLVNGAASASLATLGAGPHTLVAAYGGDGLNPSASSAATVITVAPVSIVATASSVAAEYGAPLPAFSGTLTGILPQDAGQVTAVYSSAASGLPNVGTYPIAVSLTGPASGNYIVSMAAGSGSLQITPAASTTDLASVTQAYEGIPVSLTANVASSTSGQPTGTVRFLDGSTPVATATLVNGSASALYALPPAGSRTLTAQYGGDRNFQASQSAAQIATVGILPDFGMSIAGATTASVQAGTAATYSLVVSAQPSPFTGVVTLSASGLPAGATASFSPVQVVPGTGSATVTVSVQTTAAQALFSGPRKRSSRTLLAAAGLLLFFGLSRKRRRILPLLGLGLLLAGCGARTVGESGEALATQGYTVQITGTSTNLAGAVVVHSTAVTLTVQN